jgi:hypothetical protein
MGAKGEVFERRCGMIRKPKDLKLIYSTGRGHGEVLEVDNKTGELYWGGKKLVTQQEVKLTPWVNRAIIVGGASTFLIAVFTILPFFGLGRQ